MFFQSSAAFRRIASGVLLITAPLLQAVAVVVDPGTWGDDREAVGYGANPVLAQLESAMYHWSWMLMAVAAFGLLHVVRRRSVVIGHIGGAMSVVGYIAVSALLLTDPVEWWLGQRFTPEQAQRHLDEMMNLPGVVFGFQMPWIFFAWVGLPLLTFAVWRAGAAHWLVPLTVTVGYVGAIPVPYGPATIAFWAAPVIGLGSVGVRFLRMSDEEWISYYPTAAPGRTTPDSYANTTA
ncbi:hypothetical protein ACQPYK_13715 [Streptosporangium sp. CA-135522]|uniref:hypothetical protein n=1 Tax=Streptosporangium sp. CA-135522 TaxID=3240072 RepID=UPI003D8D7CEC